jgi:hypothetical protein
MIVPRTGSVGVWSGVISFSVAGSLQLTTNANSGNKNSLVVISLLTSNKAMSLS